MKRRYQALTNTKNLLAASILLIAAGMANAQVTFVNQPTTTTLWAGSQDTTLFGFSSFTAPGPGVILSGTAISAITGKPVRHLWYGDPLAGLCRVDPEVDAVIPPVNGIGGHNISIPTCLVNISFPFPVPGQLAFDSSTNTLYAPDISSRTGLGIIRFHYIPSGDNGQGAVDLIHIESLIGTTSTRNAWGGCPQVKDPKTNTLVPVVPNSAALGPDGNLYTGSFRDGAIIRIMSPATFNPVTDCPGNGNSGVVPGPSDKIQIPILSADEAFGSGHTFGLGWVGGSLIGADNIAPWIMANAAQCFTSLNGNKICGAPALGGQAPMPTEILGTVVPGPQAGAASDAQYPNFPGTAAYFATFPNVARVTNIASASSMTVQLNYGGTFSFITGLTADPTSGLLFVGADPTQGGINGSGQIWLVSSQGGCGAAPPLAPVITSAVAGLNQATVAWSLTLNGCQATSYVVRTLLAGGAASGVADVTVTSASLGAAPPAVATILGLTNGASYQFEVQACTAAGCSALSALSNVVTLAPPSAPTGVTATVAGATSANVTWVRVPDPSIKSYTVSAFDALAPGLVAASVAACATCGSSTVTGLLNSHTYTFTVHATNVFGNSPESAPSLPLTLPLGADMAITIIPPPAITAGSPVTFVVPVINNGPANVPQVTILLSAFGNGAGAIFAAPFSSFSASQGLCTAASVDSLSCSLGAMNAGTSATVTVTIGAVNSAVTSITANATVFGLDATGAAVPDPNLANNSGSATVALLPPPVSTDIQVVGAAQNGGPAVGSADTFTWQIKDNQGTTAAPGVVFTSTLPPSFRFTSVTPSQGTCSAPAAGSLGGTITCGLGTINGGATAIVTVNFTPTGAGTFSTTGSATFAGADTNPANNSFTVTIGPK